MDTCEHLEGLGRCVCRCCGVETTSEGHLTAHVAGRKHEKRMELFRCDICNFLSSSHVTMAQHWKSKRHKVRMPPITLSPSRMASWDHRPGGDPTVSSRLEQSFAWILVSAMRCWIASIHAVYYTVC